MKHTLFILLSLLLAGCGLSGITQPTLFYTLTAADPVPQNNTPKTNISIGLGPISLPLLLDRPQMVLRKSNTEIDVDEFHRWGEELKSNLSHVMVRNLMHDLQTNRVAHYPWPEYRRLDYQVIIEIYQFEAQRGEQVVLEGVWSLVDRNTRQELAVEHFSFHVIMPSSAYTAVAEGHSQALRRLSQLIAARIQPLKPTSD